MTGAEGLILGTRHRQHSWALGIGNIRLLATFDKSPPLPVRRLFLIVTQMRRRRQRNHTRCSCSFDIRKLVYKHAYLIDFFRPQLFGPANLCPVWMSMGLDFFAMASQLQSLSPLTQLVGFDVVISALRLCDFCKGLCWLSRFRLNHRFFFVVAF